MSGIVSEVVWCNVGVSCSVEWWGVVGGVVRCGVVWCGVGSDVM